MTNYEKCIRVRHILLTAVGEVVCYNWSQEFSYRQIKERPEKLLPQLDGPIDPTKLTAKQMDDLFFGSSGDHRLVPLWLYPFLPDEIHMVSISGKQVFRKENMDTEHRGGFLAFGVRPAAVAEMEHA